MHESDKPRPGKVLLSCWLALQVVPACGAANAPTLTDEPAWRKGNLHTHSLWSDGDDFPEMVVDWYAEGDYDFVALSDHNVLAEGERFIEVPAPILAAYQDRFGESWVELRGEEVRLKTLAEYRTLFEEPGRFLIIQSEEITDRFESVPIHVNATNVEARIEPQGGTSVRDVMQRNVDAVLAQREATGQKMFPHINHPNYGGHPLVHNEGDAQRPGTERMWDIVLTERLASGTELMYGIAVDDAHSYHDHDGEHANPGRGWVMVYADELTAEALVEAMERGDFYGSSGITLSQISVSEEGLALTITPEAGVTYRTQFIGTRTGYDAAKPSVDLDDGAVSYRYSEEIGQTLAEVEGTSPSYRFGGDEIYVRARVTSSKLKANPYRVGELESAWVQPVVRLR